MAHSRLVFPSSVEQNPEGVWCDGKHIDVFRRKGPIPRKREKKPDYIRPRRLDATPLEFPNAGRSQPSPSQIVWSQNDGYIYVGFNTPQIHVPPRKFRNGLPSFEQMKHLDWEQPGFPYLAFSPLSLAPHIFRGSLLRRFAINGDRFPLRIDKKEYRRHTLIAMDRFLVEAWVRAEINILRVIDILMRTTGYKYIRLPDEFIPDARRLHNFVTEEQLPQLIDLAIQIRERFIVLFSLVCFFSSLRQTFGYYEINGEKVLTSQFQGDIMAGGVHVQWSGILQNSLCGDRRTRRRGVIIDLRKSNFTFLIPYMLLYNMPVILRIDEQTVYRRMNPALEARLLGLIHGIGMKTFTAAQLDKHSLIYVPPREVIAKARDAVFTFTNDAHDVDFEPSADLPSPNPPEPSSFSVTQDHSKSAPTSSLPTTRTQFIEERKRMNEIKRENASDKERQRIATREQNAKTFNPPGRNNRKTKVFLWQYDDDGRESERTMVDACFYDSTFKEYTTDEMWYDPVRDKWHIWNSRWHPGKSYRPEEEDDPNGSVINEPGVDFEVVENNRTYAPLDFNSESFREDILLSIAINFDMEEGHHVDAIEATRLFPLIKRMTAWFGFLPDVNPEGQSLVKIPARLDRERMKHVLRDSILDVDEALLTRMCNFLVALSDQKSISRLPQIDFPIHSIQNFGSRYIRVRSSPYQAQEFQRDSRFQLRRLYSVELLDNEGRIRYDNRGRRIFVWTATAALAIKRYPFDSSCTVDEVAEFLLGFGISYVTAVERSTLRLPRDDFRVPGLGNWTRPEKLVDPVDFFAYLDKCRNMLTIDRLKRFLRCGGIIWRLATLFIHFGDALENSPSPDALNEPMVLEGPCNLVDDGITKEEMELLIGMFEVPHPDGKSLPAQYSYWPLPYVWEKNGYNMGPWNPDNEDWFVGRIKQYSTGIGQVLNVQHWNKKVEGFRDSISMMRGMENRA